MRRMSFAGLMLVAVVAGPVLAQDPGNDPPARVGRVSALDGAVSLYPVGGSDWTTALLNYPLTGGDALWADSAARAEVHLGSSAIRIGARTAVTFGEVSDSVTQVRVDEGSIDVHVRALDDNELYEIDTPSGVISLVAEGHYRIDVWPDGRRTTITVRDGEAAVERDDGGDPWTVRANSSATLFGAGTAPRVGAMVPVDDWERWADSRDQREDDSRSTEFVSRETVGYEDLDDYGNWQTDVNYGNVWYPNSVPSGWAPYRDGRWSSVAGWGWTWVDQEPWGFAPFHYGRWAWLRGRWGWVPGPPQLHPVYAPALVAFVGGPGWEGGVGWVPLAPGERYVPPYRTSAGYVSRVNPLGFGARGAFGGRSSGEAYANRNVPGALTAIPQDAFTRSRPVPAAALPVRPTDVATARPAPPPTPPPHDAGRTGAGRPGRSSSSVLPPSRPVDGRRPPVAGAAAPLPAPWRGRPRPGSPGAGAAPPAPVIRQGNATVGAPVAPPHTAPVPAPQPAAVPANQPPPGRPAPRPTGAPGQPPQQLPAQPQPPAASQTAPAEPAGRPDRPARTPEVRPRPLPVVRPPDARPPADNSSTAEWQQQRAQLVQRQEAENAALAKQQATQRAAQQAAANQAQAQQQQQAQRKALEDKQQHQRDQLDKQYRRPVPAKAPPPPPPPPPPAPDHKPV